MEWAELECAIETGRLLIFQPSCYTAAGLEYLLECSLWVAEDRLKPGLQRPAAAYTGLNDQGRFTEEEPTHGQVTSIDDTQRCRS